MAEAPYTPPAIPEESGYYWALLLWEFNMELRTIVEVRHGRLFALTLSPGETPTYREIIHHDILRWGRKLEFPEIPE